MISASQSRRPSRWLQSTRSGSVVQQNDPDPAGHQILQRPEDRQQIEKQIRRIKSHYNSYYALRDAQAFLAEASNTAASRHIKAAVIFAASAVEASLRFYADMWGVKFSGSGDLDRRIEQVLSEAGRPSYRKIENETLLKLRNLYLARNSIHWVDCSYREENSGTDVIVDKTIATDLVEAAKRFIFWLESIS